MVIRVNLLLLPFFLFFTIKTFAQTEDNSRIVRANQFYIGVEGSGVLNFSTYNEHSTVDQGFRKPPLPAAAWGLTLRQDLTHRLALEIGISLIGFGYKSVYTSSYPAGKRWEAQTISTDGIGRFQVPVRVLLLLPPKNSPWRKYLSLGVNGFYNENWGQWGNVGGGGSFGGGFPFRDSLYPAPRFTVGLSLGGGTERNMGKWGLIQLGAVYNLGFRPLAVWDLEYTTWDISRAVDGITHHNTIVNKGSYLGLRLSMLFKL